MDDEEDQNIRDEIIVRAADSPRTSSPLSAVSEDGTELEIKKEIMHDAMNDVPAFSDNLVHNVEALKTNFARSAYEAVVKPASRQASPIPLAPLPDGIDLPAILASTVVFSGSSKLSLPDLVKHMLEVNLIHSPVIKNIADDSLNRVSKPMARNPPGTLGLDKS